MKNKEQSGKRQTVKQFIASCQRLCPKKTIHHQVNLWPYPQSGQSHITFWMAAQSPDKYTCPDKCICVYLSNSDIPGALVRINHGERTPSEVIRDLIKINE